MGSITDVEGACDACGGRTDDLQRRAGDNVCEQCDVLLTAAHALLDNNVLDEPAILGTLVFAWSRGAGAVGPEDYGGLELLSSVDGVPLLRLPRITAGVITYDGSRIPKAAEINVYSRDVGPQELAEVYERLLKEQGIHFDKCSAGSVYWDTEDTNLTLTVRAMKELHPGRVPLFKTYPAGRIYSFPPPLLVSGFYGTLLGSTHKKTFSGYAYALAESGAHAPLNAVTGSVAWLLGERDYNGDYNATTDSSRKTLRVVFPDKSGNNAPPPRERRPRIAKALNKHLLAPRNEQKLPEDYWVPDNTVWRAAFRLGPRLARNLHHLQEGFKQQFP